MPRPTTSFPLAGKVVPSEAEGRMGGVAHTLRLSAQADSPPPPAPPREGEGRCAWLSLIVLGNLVFVLFAALPARATTCDTIAWEIVQARWQDLRAPAPFVEDIQRSVDISANQIQTYARNRCDGRRLVAVLDCTETDDGLPKGSRIKRTGKNAATEAELRRLFDACWRPS